MIAVLRLLVAAARSCFGSRLRLQTENLVLRHQINILRRAVPRRVRPTRVERLWFVWLYRLWPDVLRSVTIIRPETVVRWHRQGWRAYWRWKSHHISGRPRVPKDVRDLIREISLANPLWGAPRIHMWTAPGLQDVKGMRSVACGHMSGLLVRSDETAGPDGFRGSGSQTWRRPLSRPWMRPGLSDPRIDRSPSLRSLASVRLRARC